MLKGAVAAALLLTFAYLAFGGSDARDQTAPPVAVAQINANPGAYYGQRIGVTGQVIAAGGIFGTGAFQLRDGSSELLVLSLGDIPPARTEVTIQGRLRQVLVIGGRRYQVFIMDNAHGATR